MKDAKTPSKKVIPIVSAPAQGGFMPMYEAQAKIYPRNTFGFFQKLALGDDMDYTNCVLRCAVVAVG